MGIEPTSVAWKAAALPLSYARTEPDMDMRPGTLRGASSPASGPLGPKMPGSPVRGGRILRARPQRSTNARGYPEVVPQAPEGGNQGAHVKQRPTRVGRGPGRPGRFPTRGGLADFLDEERAADGDADAQDQSHQFAASTARTLAGRQRNENQGAQDNAQRQLPCVLHLNPPWRPWNTVRPERCPHCQARLGAFSEGSEALGELRQPPS
jgi:hypothetical protein